MKYSEFHRMIRSQGWVAIRQNGSHVIYSKEGKTFPVPNHGAKEMHEGLRKSIMKMMQL